MIGGRRRNLTRRLSVWRATGGTITPAAEAIIVADVVDTAGVMAVIMSWMAVIEDSEVLEMAVTLAVVAEGTAVVAILMAVIVVVMEAVVAMEEAVEGIIMVVDIIMVAEGEATITVKGEATTTSKGEASTTVMA